MHKLWAVYRAMSGTDSKNNADLLLFLSMTKACVYDAGFVIVISKIT